MSRKIHFTVKVPNWVPDTQDIKYLYKTIKFFFNPFRCADCNKKLNFKRPEYKGKCLVHAFSFKGDYAYCRDCLAKRIEQYFATDALNYVRYDKPKVRKCDCCNNEKLCATTIEASSKTLVVRFGVNWWNGHWVCKDCLVECVKTGRISSGVLNYKRGKTYAINEAGVPIFIKKGFTL